MENFEHLDIDQGAKQHGYETAQPNKFDLITISESIVPNMAHQMETLVNAVINGEIDPLIVFATFKQLETAFKKSKEAVDSYAIEEATRYNAKSFKAHGCDFNIKEGSKLFDYSSIPQWVSLKEQMKEIEEIAKTAYIANEKKMLTASSDGEELILPIVKFSKSSLIVK